MKLDRNKNPDGRGKYALIHLRELTKAESAELHDPKKNLGDVKIPGSTIQTGAESPGDMFFVLKYKDKFAAAALRGYQKAINEEIFALTEEVQTPEIKGLIAGLAEYAQEIRNEAELAEAAGASIPD